MIYNIYLISITVAATAILAYILSIAISRNFVRLGMSGADVHKPERPPIAEMGGLAILVAVLAGAGLLLILDSGATDPLFVFGLGTIMLVGLVGVLDDLRGIRQRYKPFLVAAASIPLIYALGSRISITFPLVGQFNFGYLYPLLIVPLAVATSANFSNMLAGFNGLEAGYAVISLGTLSGLAALRDEWNVAFLGLLLFGGYFAFLTLNWYPAKLFPGDTGTLMAGAAIATIGLCAGLEFAAIVLSMPAALDFTLKVLSKNPFSARSRFGDTVVGADGALHPPAYAALSHAFMRVSPSSERGLVVSLLGLEIIYAAVAVILTLGLL